jgi:hypothetical protein
MTAGQWYLWRDLMVLIQAEKRNYLGGPLLRARRYELIETEDLPTKGENEFRTMPHGAVLKVSKPGLRYRLTPLGEACQRRWRQDYGLQLLG